MHSVLLYGYYNGSVKEYKEVFGYNTKGRIASYDAVPVVGDYCKDRGWFYYNDNTQNILLDGLYIGLNYFDQSYNYTVIRGELIVEYV